MYCMSYLDCLPMQIAHVLAGLENVREVRIRNGCAVSVNVGGRKMWLSEVGLTSNAKRAFIFDGSCDDIVNKACQGSVYAYESMLAKGFFTLDDGTRFGVCGRYVACSGVFASFTSLCLRIPHDVRCLSSEVVSSIATSRAIGFVGAPGTGKTTCLRNLARTLAATCNVVVCDERAELSAFCTGSGCDILVGADKTYAFSVAARTLAADWIVCDELATDDVSAVNGAIDSGVKVAFSAHGRTVEDFRHRFPSLSNSVSTLVLLDEHHRQTVVNLVTMTKNGVI